MDILAMFFVTGFAVQWNCKIHVSHGNFLCICFHILPNLILMLVSSTDLTKLTIMFLIFSDPPGQWGFWVEYGRTLGGMGTPSRERYQHFLECGCCASQ